MQNNLTVDTQETRLIVRCECGAVVTAEQKKSLVERVRLHLGEFHPDLGAAVPADLILAMAECDG
jgi:hypothetical protein